MKTVLAILVAVGFASTANASVKVYNSSGADLGSQSEVKCANGLACSVISGQAAVSLTSGDGSTALSGFRGAQTSASGDLAASNCGYTVSSDGVVGSANGPIDLFNLPLISSALLGCRINFVVGTLPTGGQKLTINPQTANQILLLTDAAGDAISADAIGESIILEATQPGWVPVGKEQGTWSDIN